MISWLRACLLEKVGYSALNSHTSSMKSITFHLRSLPTSTAGRSSFWAERPAGVSCAPAAHAQSGGPWSSGFIGRLAKSRGAWRFLAFFPGSTSRCAWKRMHSFWFGKCGG